MRPSPFISEVRRISAQDGMTLAELMVAMGLLSIVLLVFTSTLASVQRSVVEESIRSELNDDARLALQSFDRIVRSGNVLYDPDDEAGNDPYDVAATGFMFRIYTQAKNQPDDGPRCALWLIDDQQQLLYRTWPPLQPETATGWRIIAAGVVNRDLNEPAFVLDADARTVTVDLEINADLARRATATQEFTSSITGRNTSFGYPVNVCQDLPSDL